MNELKHVGRRGRSRRESGSAVVEFSLVFLPLALILLGICQYGLMYAAKIAIGNASVAAARYAVLSVTNAPSVLAIQNYATQAATADPFLGTNNVTVTVVTNVTVGATNGATSVQIQYNLPLIIPFVVPGAAAGSSVSLSATTIMR